MAINIPMTSGDAQGSYPLPFPGETFLLTRDKLSFSFRDAAHSCKNARGRLYMTNMRMVFRIAEGDRARARCETFEMPFRGLWDEKLNQPIFGTNNLTATMMYYDDQPFQGDLYVKLTFNEGGVGTFLAVFNNVLRATRIQLNRERIQGQQPAPIPEVQPGAPAPNAASYMPASNEAAYVDPNDPSRIYTTAEQPVFDSNQQRQGQPAWSVSGDGMRRRR